MLKTRLIPILLLQNGFLVRSELFKIHQRIGDPYHEVKRYNEWNVDELIYLDITQGDEYLDQRLDTKNPLKGDPLDILDEVSKTCFIPLTWGGKLKSVEDMNACFNHGADKIAINSQAVKTPELITEGSKNFGSQAIVVSIDTFKHEDGRYEVYIDGGKTATGLDPVKWAIEAAECGAGEILLQCIDRDGVGCGYDTGLIKQLSDAIKIPLIACSGVGMYEHYVQGVRAGASAVAAANIWHFKELSDRGGKRALQRGKVDVRM